MLSANQVIHKNKLKELSVIDQNPCCQKQREQINATLHNSKTSLEKISIRYNCKNIYRYMII